LELAAISARADADAAEARWQRREAGDFDDFDDLTISNDEFRAHADELERKARALERRIADHPHDDPADEDDPADDDVRDAAGWPCWSVWSRRDGGRWRYHSSYSSPGEADSAEARLIAASTRPGRLEVAILTGDREPDDSTRPDMAIEVDEERSGDA
jgi:hypothetical protein